MPAEEAGDAGQIIREVDLREGPSFEAPSLGRLPKGTIVTQKGERRDRFYLIEVELEEGTVQGWVPEDSLSEASKGGVDPTVQNPRKREPPEYPGDGLRPTNRIRVPKDEGLLLRRDQTFFYGLHGGLNFNIMQTDIDADNYVGLGIVVGAHVGIFATQSLTLHVEFNYSRVEGVGDTNGALLQFGFFDSNIQLRYLVERIELFGGLQYSVGLSLNDVDPNLNIGTAQDLSSLYALGGVGYRFPLTDVLWLSIRVRYATAFLRAPVAIQMVGGLVHLEFEG